MRRPPSILRAPHYPATAGTILLAPTATLAAWAKVDVSLLLEDAHLAHGQIWRLLTSALLHANAIHLVLNFAFLWIFGTIVEEHFGAGRTFALFALLAAASGAAEFALFDGGIGLSGANYGLFAMLWVLARRDGERFGDAVDPRLAALLAGWFFLCIGLTVSGIYAVANVAHATGAALGALLGWAMTVPFPRRAQAQSVTAAATIALLAAATLARPYLNHSDRRGTDGAYLGYRALLSGGDDRAAAWWFRDATAARPGNADYWFNRGVAESRLQNARGALYAYERAAALSPLNSNYRTALAEMKTYIDQSASGPLSP